MKVAPSVRLPQPVILPSVVTLVVQLTQSVLLTEHNGSMSVSVNVITLSPLTLSEADGEVITTVGAVVSLVASFVPVPRFPAASVWFAVAVMVSPSVRV